MQQSIDDITWYLSINNIPQNQDKTNIMTSNEYGYEPIHDQTTKYQTTDIRQHIDTHSSMTTIPIDPLSILRSATFKILDKKQKKTPTTKTLRVHIDNNWTFTHHIQYITNKMKLIRHTCNDLINSNRNALNIDVINSSLSLCWKHVAQPISSIHQNPHRMS